MPKPQKVRDFEEQYQELYAELIAMGGQAFMDKVNKDFREAIRNQRAYGTNGADDMVNEYAISDHNEVRRLRGLSHDLAPEMRGIADTLFSYMGDLMEADNSLSSMNDYLAKFEDFYTELEEDPLLSDDRKEAARASYAKVIALRDQIQSQIAAYKFAKAYNTHMLNWMLGADKSHMDDRSVKEQEKSWRDVMEEFECSHQGMDPEATADALKGAVIASQASEKTAVIVNIEAASPQLGDAFVAGIADREKFSLRDLTLAEKGFAVQNFDLAFHKAIISEKQLSDLRRDGKDIFDLIYIDGRSMNDLYAEKYASSPYYSAVEMMKCEFMADMLQGKDIHLLVPGEEATILPIQAQSEMGGIKELLEEASQRKQGGHHYGAEISQAQQALEQRTRRQIEEKKERMRESKPLYEELNPVEPNGTFQFRLRAETVRTQGRQFAIRERSGKLAANPSDSQQLSGEKSTLVQEGAFLFNIINNNLGVNRNHEIYAQAGIQDETQLYYIDGKPAHEYVKGLYPDMELDIAVNPQAVDLIKTEILSAALSGKHYVEAVKVGMDEKGGFQVGVTQVQLDVRALDGQEKFYQTKPSKRMESLLKNDKHREQRQDDIRARFSEKLAVAATRALRQRENQKEPHAVAYRRFELSRTELTKDYFDDASLSVLKAIPDNASAELPRGNFGGYRTYAQLLVMAQHPEIRFADLMNPDMYREEKLAAGREVAQAFSKLYAGPDPQNPESKEYLQEAATIMKTAMGVMAGLDVRKELLYALDEPEGLDAAATKEAMGKPENVPVVNGFLRAMSSFSVNTFQALGRVVNGKDLSVSTLDPEKAGTYPPIYAELAGMAEPELVQRYRAANNVTRALNVEKRWNERIAEYMENGLQKEGGNTVQDAIASRIIAEQMRDRIAEYGKASEIPNAQEMMMMSSETNIRAVGERVKKAMESKEPGLSMDHLMHSNLSREFYSRMVAEAKMAQAIAEKGAADAWKDVLRENGSLFASEAYFRDDQTEVFRALEKPSKLNTLNRPPSRASVARIYMMGVQGYSMGETISPDNAEARLQAGDGLFRMLNERQFQDGMDSKIRKASARAYGEMYHNAAQKMISETIPAVDWRDPCAVAAVFTKLNAIQLFSIDYSQTKEDILGEDGFADAYGGTEAMAHVDDQIDWTGHFIKSVMNAHGIQISPVSIHLNQRASGMMIIDQCSQIFSGRSMKDLTPQDMQKMNDTMLDGMALEVWAADLNPEQERKLQDYVDGKGPLPDEAKAAIQANRQMRSRTRVGLDGVTNQEARANDTAQRTQNQREVQAQNRRQARQQERESQQPQNQPRSLS